MQVNLVWVLSGILLWQILKALYRRGEMRRMSWDYSLDFIKCSGSYYHTKFVDTHQSQHSDRDPLVEKHIKNMEYLGWQLLSVNQTSTPASGFVVLMRKQDKTLQIEHQN